MGINGIRGKSFKLDDGGKLNFMYFSGLTKCFICCESEELKPDEPSGWRAILAERKIYYFCAHCLPDRTGFATTEEWAEFYETAIGQIYFADFNRPIRKILILRDVGGNPQIINANLN
jgi:hypothetical protein